MGTNYYLEATPPPPCPCCGRGYETQRLHIGKSSGGWCFSLHVIPEEGINSLADWQKRWSLPGFVIRDEYGDTHTSEQMLSVITVRAWGRAQQSASWYAQNHAVPGPNGLARHQIGRYCVGHGEGTWDLIPGDFS